MTSYLVHYSECFTWIISFNPDNFMKCKYYCYPHFKAGITKAQQCHKCSMRVRIWTHKVCPPSPCSLTLQCCCQRSPGYQHWTGGSVLFPFPLLIEWEHPFYTAVNRFSCWCFCTSDDVINSRGHAGLKKHS